MIKLEWLSLLASFYPRSVLVFCFVMDLSAFVMALKHCCILFGCQGENRL